MPMALPERPFERACGDYVISDDATRFDADALHDFLESEGYWARGRSRQATAVAVANSVVLGVYGPDGSMVGGARVVTDRATFGWLTDVYVLAAHRGRGLGRALAAAACEHPALATVKRLVLMTAGAHELYRPLGFAGLASPQSWMELTPHASQAGPADAAGDSADPPSPYPPAGQPEGRPADPANEPDRQAGDSAPAAESGIAALSEPATASGVAASGRLAAESGMVAPGGLVAHTPWRGHCGDPRTSGVSQIASHLLGIIEAEGPVTSERAYRLYIRGAGSSKVTQRARAPLEQALGRLTLRGQVEAAELDNAGESQQVLRPSGSPAVVVRELGERSLYEVPLDEVAELMRRKRRELTHGAGGRSELAHAVAAVVQQARLRRAGPDRLKRAVLDAYGLVRMTQAAEQYLSAALALLDDPEP